MRKLAADVCCRILAQNRLRNSYVPLSPCLRRGARIALSFHQVDLLRCRRLQQMVSWPNAGSGLTSTTNAHWSDRAPAHWALQVDPENPLTIGERIRTVPNRLCVTSNMFDEVWVEFEGGNPAYLRSGTAFFAFSFTSCMTISPANPMSWFIKTEYPLSFAAEAGNYSQAGHHVIACSPGDMAERPTVDEYIKIDDLAAGQHL